MSKVLIVATSKYTRGGITAVIKAQQQGEQWDHFHCKWLGYHIDRAQWIKILFFVSAFIRYLFILPFYNIIHFQFSLEEDAKRSYILFKIAKLLRKKTIIHLHCGDQLPYIWNSMYEELFKRCDFALVLSPSIKRKVEEYIGTGYHVEVLYNPCPTIDRVTPFCRRKKEILFAGTLNSNKGYKDLIKAFSIISTNHKDWNIVFAGNGEIEQARQLSKTLKVDSQCIFLGWVNGEQKDAAFRRAAALCLASYQEGFPMAVLDAWAYGIPVVCTPAGGLVDIIKDSQNGLLFDAGNVKLLSEKLEMIILNQELRERLATESKKLADTVFRIDNINKQLGDIYRTLSN